MSKDQVKGRIEKATGKAKEVAGKMVGGIKTTWIENPVTQRRYRLGDKFPFSKIWFDKFV